MFFRSNKDNNTITLSKHVQRDHIDEYNKWVLYLKQQKKILKLLKTNNNIKRKVAPPSHITSFFGSTIPYHKSDLAQHAFLEDL
jgi:hypothetical protein